MSLHWYLSVEFAWAVMRFCFGLVGFTIKCCLFVQLLGTLFVVCLIDSFVVDLVFGLMTCLF